MHHRSRFLRIGCQASLHRREGLIADIVNSHPDRELMRRTLRSLVLVALLGDCTTSPLLPVPGHRPNGDLDQSVTAEERSARFWS